jgi:lysophospholipase L1-like esterase
MQSISLALAGQVSEPIEVGPGARVTATGSGRVEWAAGTLADARNGVVTWANWPRGASVGVADTLRRVLIRGVATGALTIRVQEGFADPGEDTAYWQQDAQWVTDANGNPVGLRKPDGTTAVVENAAGADLSTEQIGAINAALNVRPFEPRTAPWEDVNLVAPALPDLGSWVNISSASETLTDPHYTAANDLTVGTETIQWQGITLTRCSGINSFFSRLRDNRAADYPMVAGRRYIVSSVVAAPFLRTDSNGIPGPWNQFCWMWSLANSSSHGHGAKLIGPEPRRIFTLVEASTTSNYRVIADPAIALSSAGALEATFYTHGFGLGGTIASGDVYIGGTQIEEAPDQSEKFGIALIGTSIDSTRSNLFHDTQDRSWPRYLEGLLSRPIFNGAIGGQNSTQLEARFDTDIAPWGVNAKYCILAANVNDFAAGFSSATYRANWLSMYNKAIAAGMIPIFVTPARRTSYNYANGPADMAAEIAHIKATYPLVIDRDLVLQDMLDANRINRVYDSDGTHPTQVGLRAFAFAVYARYRHLFAFNNWPRPYQRNALADGGSVQNHGGPLWIDRFRASRIDAAGGVTSLRENTQLGTAPVLVFHGTQGSAKTWQLPVPHYNSASLRSNTDIRRQTIVNATGDGFAVNVQYYARDADNVLVTVGSVQAVPAGEARDLMTDGTTAWRVL